MQANKVWLIGADSFTGGYLAPELEQNGYFVDTTLIDITNAEQLDSAMSQIQPNYVINLAAISFVPDGESTAIYAVNTFGAENVLKAALKLETRPKHIILASSANVYGAQLNEKIDELCQTNPVNHYGCSKWAMEQIAKNYSEQLNITVTRPFNYTGVSQLDKFLIPKIVSHFQQKASNIMLGNIDVSRDFSDVRWIAKAYAQLLGLEKKHYEVVNLCSGNATSIKQMIDYLQPETQHSINIEVNPAFVRKNDIKTQCGDNTKLFSLCPGLAAPTPIEELLYWMLNTSNH
jgi:nucleoside-diphosphate-sugar epimerase